MKKIIGIIIVLAVIGGGAFFFLNGKKKDEDKPLNVGENWNQYSTKENHLVTLNDRMISIANGSHIAKFTITLKFKDTDGYEKFMGLEKPLTEKERKAEAEGEHKKEEGTITPMNVKINDLVTTFMMTLGNEEVKNLDSIKQNMKKYLNDKLSLGKDFIQEVYIEQYVIN